MKFLIGSISVLLHMPIASTSRCVENMSLRVSFLGSFWVPKKNMIQAFSHFLKWYTPFVFTCLLEVCLGVFPRAAEFVRPSGLLLYHFCVIKLAIKRSCSKLIHCHNANYWIEHMVPTQTTYHVMNTNTICCKWVYRVDALTICAMFTEIGWCTNFIGCNSRHMQR